MWELISVIDLIHNRLMIQSMVNIVLFKRMLLSQIYWGMFVNPDWQFSWDLLFYWFTSPKITRCGFRPMVKSTNAIFSNDPRHFLAPPPLSLSLPNPVSLCLSFSLLCSIPYHVLPVLISLKYSTDWMFDYHWSQQTDLNYNTVSLRGCSQ